MKKLIAVLLTIVMVCSLSVSAWAAPQKVSAKTSTEADVTEFNWEEVEDAAPDVDPDAAFFQVGDWNLKMWIPSVFTEQELTDEDIADGILSFMATEDGEAGVMITISDNEGGDGLDAWRDALVDLGCEDAEIIVINGIEALAYSDEDSDTMNVIFLLLDSEEVLQFTFWPWSDEDFQAVVYIMISSLQAME